MKKNTKSTGQFTKILLTLLFILTNFSIMHAQQFKLFRTPKTGNVVTLTTRAKIIRITRTPDVKSYSIWRNGKAYLTINRFKLNANNGVAGILPPGRYVLRTLGGSVTIELNTNFRPENITLWARQNKIVKPLWDGNLIVLTSPTNIVKADYDGTQGMGVYYGKIRPLYFISPHNRTNPGPKVINGSGGYLGKTLVGQILQPGIYRLVLGRGNTDGIIYGQIVLTVR